MRIRVRLTLIFAGALGAIVAVAGVVLTLTMRAQLRATTDDGLLSRAQVIRAAYESGRRGVLEGASLIPRDEAFAQIIDSTGTVAAASAGVGGEPLLEDQTLGLIEIPSFFTRRAGLGGEEIPIRLLALRLPGGDALIVGASLEEQQEAVGTVTGLLLLGGPLVIALGAWLVWSVTGAALRPVERLREEADAVSVSDAGRLLTVTGTDDEIARLGRSFNSLLTRLDDALKKERRFVDDASHELRTPVSRIRSELELALSESNSAEETRAALRMALADADDLAQLTDDLLVLARMDQGRLPIRREEVDLAVLVDQVAAGFKGRIENGVTLNIDARGMYSLDPLRFRQVLINLLDNALHHAPAGGSVWVRSLKENDELVLEVEDTGPGFTASALASPVEPFSRAPDERSRAGGAGLGLSIVKAIAEAHGGSISLANREGGGALVGVRFRKSSEI